MSNTMFGGAGRGKQQLKQAGEELESSLSMGKSALQIFQTLKTFQKCKKSAVRTHLWSMVTLYIYTNKFTGHSKIKRH